MPIDVAIFFAGGDLPEDASELVNMRGGSDVDSCCGFDGLNSGIVVLGGTVASSRVSITNWPVGPEASFPSFISTPCTRMEMVTSVGSPEDIALRLKIVGRHEW
jgi:hypothetical protein